MNRKIIFLIFSLLLITRSSPAAQDSQPQPALIVFHSPTCHKCIEVKNEVIPQIQKEFAGRITVEYRDITNIENYKLLLGLKEKHRDKSKNTVPVFYLSGRFLGGRGDVKANLRRLITESLNKPPEKNHTLPIVDLINYFQAFTPLAVTGAGLIDGINPCAFTVIVFFISFLALQGYRKRDLVIIGLSFIFSVFLTYLFIGLGLFGFLYKLKGFWVVSRVANILIGVFSISLGFFALYDFFQFKKTGSTEGLVLQLPRSIKNQIHKIIGLHYRQDKTQRHIFNLLLSALITGFLVSILEAVCTGQTYLPTIGFILKTTPLKLAALSYLLLYNLMFIIPLLIIFIFALFGATSQDFAKFLKKNMLSVKILMAMLFFGLGIFLLWRM